MNESRFMNSDSFEKVIQVLNGLENQGYLRSYAIAGAMATMFYTEAFYTEDLDILILVPREREESLNPLSDIYDFLKKQGHKEEREYIRIDGILVQFLVASDPLFKEALENAIETPYGQTKTRVLTPEYLLALMAKAGRPKDFLKMNYLLDQKIDIDRKALDNILLRHELMERWARFEKNRQ